MAHIDCFVSSLVNGVIERSINKVQRLIFFSSNPFCLSATKVTFMWMSSGLRSSSFWETDMHWPVEHFVIVAISAALHASYTHWFLWHHCKFAVSLILAPFCFLFWVGGDGYGGTDLISLITFHSKRKFTPVGNLGFSLLALLTVSANQMVPLTTVTSEIFIIDHLAY